MTQRLTADMRSTTVTNILKAKLTEEYVAIADRMVEVANTIYEDHIPGFIRDLPEGTCPTYNFVSFKIGDDYLNFRFNGHFNVEDKEENYNRRRDWSHYFLKREHINNPFPYNKGGQCLVQLSPGSKRYNEIKAVVDDANNFIVKFFTARKKALGILNSVQTVPKLLEVWPEVEPYIAEQAPKPQLPALPISEINAVLRLP